MKTNTNRRFKGSVLFTVVSVMALLIIFLMGTLVLASSANNRAHKSYSTSQTQYTARAAVDSILAAVGDPSPEGIALANSIQSLDDVTDTPINVSVDIGDTSLGRVTNANISLVDPAYPVYDSVKQKWVHCRRYAISAEVTLGKDTTTVTSYVLYDAPVGTSGGGGGGFTTNGGVDGAGNHTSAVGGTYIALGNASTKQYIGTSGLLSYDLTDKLYLSDSGRGHDASNNPVAPYKFGNKYLMEVPFVIDGSMQMNAEANFLIPHTGEGIAVWGDLDFGNYAMEISSVNMNNQDSDLTTPTVLDAYEFTDIPYLYVDGKITTQSNLRLGNGTMPLNVFCGYIEPVQNNSCQIYADVYCYDADKTTVLGANNSSSGRLYQWASSVVNQGVSYNYHGGNFYSKGSLKINSFMKIEGDVKVEGNADITNEGQLKTIINGDLIVNGDLNLKGATVYGNVVCYGNATIENCDIYRDLSVEGSLTVDTYSQSRIVNIYNDATSGMTYAKLLPEYDYYYNDFHYNELLPGYTMEENTYHDDEYRLNCTGYENELMPIVEVYNAQENASAETGWKPADKAGNILDWGWSTLYYVDDTTYYNYEPYAKKDVDGNPTDTATTEQFVYYNTSTGAEIDEDEAKGSYYTRWDDPTVEIGNQYCYYNPTGAEVTEEEAIEEYYFTRPSDPNTVIYDGVTFYLKADAAQTPVPKDEATQEETVGDASTSPYAGLDIFPDYAEKAIILGLETLPGKNVDDTKILNTVKEIAAQQLVPTDFETSIPFNVETTVDSNVYNGATVPDTIDTTTVPGGHCTIEGNVSGKTITIVPPDNGEMWIKLKGTTFDTSRIIVDDTSSTHGTVNFFVEGDVNLKTGSKIVTKTYDHLFNNQNKDIWVSKDVAYKDTGITRAKYTDAAFWDNSTDVVAPVPNIYIYSADEFEDPITRKIPKNSLYIENGTNTPGCITAYIKAPYMLLDGVDFGAVSNTVYYDNADVFSYLASRRANIGCVICFEASLVNDWLNIYVPEASAVTPPTITGGGLGEHTYQAVDYSSY